MQIDRCDAENIVSALMKFLAHSKFDVENLVVIGVDDASTLAGINNGVHTRVKKDVP